MEIVSFGAEGIRGHHSPLLNAHTHSIDSEHPVMQQPLAVCDEKSVAESDRFLYVGWGGGG